MKAAEIRERFLKYFEKNGHTIEESSACVPQNDPTLLFTNAGMVQFKDVFLGKEKRDYKRATTSQKCVRAGGKHNDLENVGFTARHHTFFEMLGNFSFGDYFKKDAIRFAWEFVTKELKLPKDRLFVSVFKDDDESAEIWEKQEGVPKDRIYRFGEEDNFWAMGDTGPCGPCSELFIDRGEKYGCGKKDCQVGCECDRYLEFWNLVFMQFERDRSGKLNPLPKPSVDTGAGLERIAAILQEVETNYETDLFQEIMEKTSKLAGIQYPGGGEQKTSFRVIADHARASTFLIGDGVLPSNEGRGYVLRRIMRRAVRHGRKLGFEKPFLNKVCGYVIDQMKKAYPDLKDKRDFIEKAVKAEEEQFLKTLERGLSLLDEEMEKIEGKKLSGQVAFKLYDTYGFPLDLTRVILKEKGLGVDEMGFEKHMEGQKSQSRKAWKGSGDEAVKAIYQKLAEKIKPKKTPTSVLNKNTTYTKSECIGLIVDGEIVKAYEHKSGKKTIEAVFEKTHFYGESGGQVGDMGSVESKNFKGKVLDVQKPIPELIVAKIEVKSGKIKVGNQYEQFTDKKRRALTTRNHTATHMMQWALLEVLGKHVKQAGSLVNDELLRFDFTHFQPMTAEEISKVEALVNEKIQEGDDVEKDEMSKEDAAKKGAIAFFGEKYGKKVRVVTVGDYSKELCGGNHVNNSSEINLFKIGSESGVAAGVRRIVAYTSEGAFSYLQKQDHRVKDLMGLLRVTSPEELPAKIQKLQDSERDLKRKVGAAESKAAGGEIDNMISQAKDLGGTVLVSGICTSDSKGIKRLREISDRIKQKKPGSVTVLGMRDDEKGKAMILAAVGPQAPKSMNAKEIIQELAPLIKGNGGGKPELAQAGGTNPAGLKQAMDEAEKIITRRAKG